MNKPAIAFAASLIVSFASEVRAMEVSGVQLPDSINVAGTPLVLNGAGLRTKLMLKLYVLGLYVPAKAKSAEAVINSTQPRRVRLVMKRALGADTVWDAFDEGIQANSSPAELAALQNELVEIRKLFVELGELKEGDILDIDFASNGDTTVTHQNQPKGKRSSKPLQQALLKIWLGQDPVQSDLKEALLKGK